MKYVVAFMLMTTPVAAQQISVFDGPNGSVATELSYPTENFYYVGDALISAPKISNYTVYNGPNGEYLGARIDTPRD